MSERAPRTPRARKPRPRRADRALTFGRRPRFLPRRAVLTALIGTAVVALSALAALGYLLSGDTLPRGAVVSGVRVGGLSREAAVQRLTAELRPRLSREITVLADGRSASFVPDHSGVQVDDAASVARAGGGLGLSPRAIWAQITGGSAIDAVLTVDRPALQTALAELTGVLGHPPVDAQITYVGTQARVQPGEPGSVLDRDSSEVALLNAVNRASAMVDLPLTTAEPDVTTAEADQVATAVARPAVADPITVSAGAAGDLQLTPGMLASAITFSPQEGTLAAGVDGARLLKAAAPALGTLKLAKATNARVEIDGDAPKIVPAADGQGIAPDALGQAVLPVLTKTGTDRRAAVTLTTTPAKVTTADLEKLGIKEVAGEFTTYFPYQPYRNTNAGRAAKLLDGTLLRPQDTFSFNKVVGPRTEDNGFTKGYVISGNRLGESVGGGVDQAATTVFNAMFFAGLKDVEHQPRALFLDGFPPGREATVEAKGTDLRFQNDTKFGVYLQAELTPATPSARGSMTVRMWSTKVYAKVTATDPVQTKPTTGPTVEDNATDCQPQAPVDGFDVDFRRQFFEGDRVVRQQDFHWRYAPAAKVTCV